MSLRPAQISDASSIAALSLEVWIGTYLKQGINAFFADYVLDEFTTANIEKLLQDPRQHCIVSQNADGIDGVMRLNNDSAGPVKACSSHEIATLYVQPRHHGTGIGQQLLSAAFDHCRAAGAPSVWLTTNSENDPAIGFYLAQGFTQIGETDFCIGAARYRNNIYRYEFSA